ncbi:uncharacterized protein LOC111518565 [Drosophila willistoni]|uniref:uncharacterized protein LOC111518565 n=1 Tax=Drosophila willistoni TaxID=7260 RepID=UPI001F07C24C|nr:uncharacterized protein LOC111518565 [Drosophila willistoni]
MSDKNPVSTFQEICQSMRERPKYTYTRTEDDGFTCTVKLLQWEADGNGSSKRYAKSAAAQKILENITPYTEEISIDDKTPVSVLEECCTKAKYGSPIYTCKEADNGEFLCTARLINMEKPYGTGYAKTKRSAKQLAASDLINTIQSSSGWDSSIVSLMRKMTVNYKSNEMDDNFKDRKISKISVGQNLSTDKDNHKAIFNAFHKVKKRAPMDLGKVKLCDRHDYFRLYPESLKEEAFKVLESNVGSVKERALNVLRALKLTPRITELPGKSSEKTFLLELDCDYDCVFMGSIAHIYAEILQYFRDMLV